MKIKHLIAGLLMSAVASGAMAQNAPSADDLIKWRQSLHQVLTWNMGRLKANVGGQYNKAQAQKAANLIAAIANSGMGELYAPGTEKGNKVKTKMKPEMLTDAEGVKKAAMAVSQEANELAKVVNGGGDASAVKSQLGKLGGTCKGCHDDFKNK